MNIVERDIARNLAAHLHADHGYRISAAETLRFTKMRSLHRIEHRDPLTPLTHSHAKDSIYEKEEAR